MKVVMMAKSRRELHKKTDIEYSREITVMLLPNTIKEYRDRTKNKSIRDKVDAIYLEIMDTYREDIASEYESKGFDGDYVRKLSKTDFLNLINKR